MARVYGVDGAATLGTAHGIVANAWTLRVEQFISEANGYGDTWTSRKGGLYRASGSVTGILYRDASSTAPGLASLSNAGIAAGTTVLTVASASTACTYQSSGSGTTIVASGTVNHAFEGNPSLSYDLQFNGAISETWDTT